MIKSENTHIINLFYDNKQYFPSSNKFRPAVFFDRDGVIIKDKHHIKDPRDVELERGAKQLIRNLFNEGIPIVIVTNQSGIFRKIFSWEDYLNVTNKVIDKLGKPNPITAIYSNGLGPKAPKDSWRKPNPNMILNASFTLKIDLGKSILIGDRLSDVECAINAGIKNIFHVETGLGIIEREDICKFINEKNSKKNIDFKITFLKDLNELVDGKHNNFLI